MEPQHDPYERHHEPRHDTSHLHQSGMASALEQHVMGQQPRHPKAHLPHQEPAQQNPYGQFPLFFPHFLQNFRPPPSSSAVDQAAAGHMMSPAVKDMCGGGDLGLNMLPEKVETKKKPPRPKKQETLKIKGRHG